MNITSKTFNGTLSQRKVLIRALFSIKMKTFVVARTSRREGILWKDWSTELHFYLVWNIVCKYEKKENNVHFLFKLDQSYEETFQRTLMPSQCSYDSRTWLEAVCKDDCLKVHSKIRCEVNVDVFTFINHYNVGQKINAGNTNNFTWRNHRRILDDLFSNFVYESRGRIFFHLFWWIQ